MQNNLKVLLLVTVSAIINMHGRLASTSSATCQWRTMFCIFYIAVHHPLSWYGLSAGRVIHDWARACQWLSPAGPAGPSRQLADPLPVSWLGSEFRDCQETGGSKLLTDSSAAVLAWPFSWAAVVPPSHNLNFNLNARDRDDEPSAKWGMHILHIKFWLTYFAYLLHILHILG
jgi:hypothetical protein